MSSEQIVRDGLAAGDADAVLMALGAFALNGSFLATDGERTIEMESQPNGGSK